MNPVMYMILGWLFGEFIHLTFWEVIKKKLNLDERKLKGVFIFIVLAILISGIASGFYRIQSYENVVLTRWNGQKVIRDTPGIKFSLFSGREVVDLRLQTMPFPFMLVGETVVTKDNHPIRVSGNLEYYVKDVKRWAIENKDVDDRLSAYMSSIIMGVIQDINYSDISNREEIEQQILSKLKPAEDLYGIEIVDFRLVYLTDTVDVLNAKTQAEADKISSSSMVESYRSEAEAISIKYSSIEDKDFIKFLELMNAIKKGEVQTIIIPYDFEGNVNVDTDGMGTQ